jgi:hypothetical protein
MGGAVPIRPDAPYAPDAERRGRRCGAWRRTRRRPVEGDAVTAAATLADLCHAGVSVVLRPDSRLGLDAAARLPPGLLDGAWQHRDGLVLVLRGAPGGGGARVGAGRADGMTR